MEISTRCLENCGKAFKKYNKCNKKIAAYSICILGTIIFVVVGILFIVFPSDVMCEFYYYPNSHQILYILVACISHMVVTSGLLLYGLIKNKSWCILLWIITMVIYWNINLGVTIISVVNYVNEGLEEEIKQTSERTVIIFLVQALWLLAVAYMWHYWKNMEEINNVANLVQYVTERSATFLAHRRHSSAAHHPPN